MEKQVTKTFFINIYNFKLKQNIKKCILHMTNHLRLGKGKNG